MPINTCTGMYTYTQKFDSNQLLGSSVAQPIDKVAADTQFEDTVLSNLLSFTPGMDSGT